MLLKNDDTFILIGDSITDVGRRQDPDGMGHGYVRMFRDLLTATRPDLNITIENRGISGDTVRKLKARWENDVIAEKPDVLSVCIGVNDVWRQLQDPRNEEEVLIDEYEATYRELLKQTVDQCGSRLALCEPTMIGETRDTPHNKLMGPYLDCVHRLAREFNAVLVPMNQAFWRAIDANPNRAWSGDGVHPYPHGHMLMAWTLFTAIGAREGAF